MKKIISAAVALMLVISLNTTVYANCHSNGKDKTAVKYSVCSIEDCTKTALHAHNSKTYAAHYYGDGHDYHEYCGVSGCLLAGYHEHDGSYCFAHTANDGHNHRSAGGCHI